MDPEFRVIDNKPGLYGGRSFPCSGCDPVGRQGETLSCAVRYGFMGYVGEFRYAPKVVEGCGGRVVIQTSRGIEIGERINLTCGGCDHSIPRQQIESYTRASGTDFFLPNAGRVLRAATQPDLQEEAKINADARVKLQYARDLARTHNLDMKFTACEHLFGGERIIFHFMAEDRVDFRDLVRDLAHEYRTRIEMHQIGARDEARLVGDFEICGRECCCRNFLKKLRPVTMRMAKLQKATLDPSKVSGRCGRLRCCLRYEHEGYEELNAKLPRSGARVRTAAGVGTVKDRHVLTQMLLIEYDEGGTFETVALEAVLETGLPKRPPMPPSGDGRSGPGDSRRGASRPSPRARPPQIERRPASEADAAPPPFFDEGEDRGGDESAQRGESAAESREPPVEIDAREVDSQRQDADEGRTRATDETVQRQGDGQAQAGVRPAGPLPREGDGERPGRRRRRRRGRGRRGGQSSPPAGQ